MIRREEHEIPVECMFTLAPRLNAFDLGAIFCTYLFLFKEREGRERKEKSHTQIVFLPRKKHQHAPCLTRSFLLSF